MSKRLLLFFPAFAVTLLLLAPPAAPAASVLFDQGHGQMFTIDEDGPLQLSQLAELFRRDGAEVAATVASLTPQLLADVDVLVCSGPFRPYTAQEIAALIGFIEQGGRLLLMLHIAPPAADLLHRLGLDFANGVVREQDGLIQDNPLDFYVSDLAQHPVTAGLERFALYGSWVLRVDAGQAIELARTGPRAWVDLNHDEKLGSEDAMQPFAVAIAGEKGAGAFLVFGDDAIFQNRFLVEENLALGRNIVVWALKRPRLGH